MKKKTTKKVKEIKKTKKLKSLPNRPISMGGALFVGNSTT